MRIKSQKTRPVRERVWETFSPPQQPRYKRQGCSDRGTVISNKRETRSTSVKGECRRAEGGRISISCRCFPPLHRFGEALPAPPCLLGVII